MKSEAEKRGDALRQLAQVGRCSVPNACVLMGINHHTLRKYISEGCVEVLYIGKRPWVMAYEIERFQREGKRTQNPSPSFGEANYGGGEPSDFGS
jgi:hypothetical protein